jgi:hypothetical protein
VVADAQEVRKRRPWLPVADQQVAQGVGQRQVVGVLRHERLELGQRHVEATRLARTLDAAQALVAVRRRHETSRRARS